MDDPVFVCPECAQNLQRHEESFECGVHGRFPIVEGIPSFTGRRDFDHHWKANLVGDMALPKLSVAREFLNPLLSQDRHHEASRILDAGCGDGVHLRVLDDEIPDADTRIFGVDISLQALKSVQGYHGEKENLVHAALEHLPFEEGYFDAVFSFGVLEYTDQPAKTFDELCRVLSPGGLIGVWMLPRQGLVTAAVLSVLRALSRIGGAVGARVIADLTVPFLFYSPSRTGLNLGNASWRQCRETILVNIASRQLHMPEPSEVEEWFARNRLEVILRDPKHPITLWGRKTG
jgi:SAM-dependent methyltransferase